MSKFNDRPHDYEITWDYDYDVQISKEHKSYLDNQVKTITYNLLKKLKVFKEFEVHPVILDCGSLGVFCVGTCELPIIGIDIDNIIEGCAKYDVNVYTAIRTTIYHELAHAMQEYKGKIFDEDEAEKFAQDYETFGFINNI